MSFTQLGPDIDGEAANDRSGQSISLSSDGTIVAIGALYNDGNGDDAGHTRIYQWDSASSSWNQLGNDIDGEAAGDWSGSSVSLSSDGTIIAIGAPYNSDHLSDSGHTRIYEWGGNNWLQRGSDIDGTGAGGWSSAEYSGSSVSLSSDGSVVAIGAWGNSSGTTWGSGRKRGRTRIYEWDSYNSSWDLRGSYISGSQEFSKAGYSVSLSNDGDVVAIGSPGATGSGYTLAGQTEIYAWNGSSWVQRGSDLDGELYYDVSGHSVSLSSDGSIVAIGAYGNDGGGSESGHTRIYEWDDTDSAWVKRGSDIDGEAANDSSGYSVSLSGDGSIVAIGAFYNEGNGSTSGHTRLYQWDGDDWVQIGTDIDGEATGDRSGIAVSLSSDGSTVAIGAHFNDGNSNESGHVRVFSLDTTAPTVQSVSSSTTDGTYKAGDTITINVVFSEAVTVTTTGGTPQLTLETGSTDQIASYSSGSGTTTLAFSYIVQAGDTASDLNYKATSSLVLNGGTIKDAVGNSATLTLPAVDGSHSLAGTSALVIDGAAPTFSSAATNTDGTKVVLTYNETLSSTTAATSAFTVSSGGVANAVTAVAISGSTVELTLTNTIKKTETITVAYSDPTTSNDANAVQDSAGNDAASLSAQSVTNNSTIASSPSSDNSTSKKDSRRNQTVAPDSSSDDSTSNHNSSRDSDSGSTLLLNDNNSFSVTAGANQGLWLTLKVLSASTSLQNTLILIDQDNNVLGSIGATQFSKNCGDHAIFIAEGSTISFRQSSNNLPINSSPQYTITQQSDGTYKLHLNDNTLDRDHDDLILDISYSATSPDPNATSMAAEQQEIHDAILDLSSIPVDGQTLQITLNSDCSFINRFALVKLNQQSSGEFTVGRYDNTAGEAFDQNVYDNLINPGGSIITATGVQEKVIEWKVSTTDAGFYAPVMISALGDLYTYGSSHVKNLGCNLFAFEDDSRISTSDNDYNDLTAQFQIIT